MNLLSALTEQAEAQAVHPIVVILSIVGYVIWVIALWRVFTKAGYPGWLAIIPVVNTVFLVKVAGLSGWWTLLLFVPIANVVLAIIIALRTGKAFGHGAVFSIFLLFFLHVIGYLIIGYGSSRYDRSQATL